jgi:phospholipid/cholesterol/gamma-HCH transport system substrate-binding protein
VLFAAASYYAQFSDSGGMSKGDKVRIVGMDVGTVQDLSIDGDHVVMKFATGTHTIGTESRVAIRTDTLLGKKVLEIEPRGAKRMRPKRPTVVCPSCPRRRSHRCSTKQPWQ